MSAITIENDLVHYEVLGRGRPVIFVHGWLGSWRYWVPTMQQLSVKYRTYALDLWGFGDSGKGVDRYNFTDQVKLLLEFMDKLGIAKAALVGHSLGAAVCLRFALQHPDRAPRLALISPPLFDLGGLDTPLPAPTPASAPKPSNGASPSNSSETIVRNPFRTLGDNPEEILARLQARNAINAAGGSPNPSSGGTRPLTSTGPALPTSIGKTILAAPANKETAPAAGSGTDAAKPAASTATPSTPSIPSPMPPGSAPAKPAAPGKSDLPNPLLPLLTGVDKTALLIKYVDRTSPDLDKLRAEVDKADTAAITKSAQSFNGVNLAAELHRLTVPTLLLHGKDDPLLPAPSDDLLAQIGKDKAAGQLLAFVEPELHHFPMLEITAKFNRLLMDFLEAQDLTNVQFKDQWRRTMR